MCRLLGVDADTETAKGFLDALISASRNDPFNNGKSHADGWGAALCFKDEYFTVRSSQPIFSDSNASSLLRPAKERVTGIFHARKAAKGEPAGAPFDSHPFAVSIGEDIVYLAHNGHIDKRKLQSEVGLDVSKMNDSEVFAHFVARQAQDFEEALQTGIEMVHEYHALYSALNLVVLRIEREGGLHVYYYNDFKEKELYYRLFLYNSNGQKAVMSSSVAFISGLIDGKGKIVDKNTSLCDLGKLGRL
ncbi:MAG: class II glutamine amidotransferase [Conexivisphaerales archaeon]